MKAEGYSLYEECRNVRTNENFVIPNAVRNQVAFLTVSQSQNHGGKAPAILQFPFFPTHLIPHCVRNDKGVFGDRIHYSSPGSTMKH